MRHSTRECNCMLLLTPSPSQNMEATQASAIPGQGSPCSPSSSYLGRLSPSKCLSNLRNFTWKHHHTLCSTLPTPNGRYIPVCTFLLQRFSAILQLVLSPQTHKSPSNRRHLASEHYCSHTPTGPAATGNCSQACATLGQGCTLTSSSLLTRVQACPKTSPLLYEFHHTLLPPVTPTQAPANP